MRLPRNAPRRRIAGFTLIELMLVVAIIGVLASLAGVRYLGYVEKARVARTIAEIRSIARLIDSLDVEDDGELPVDLAEIEVDSMVDPWGNPYHYLLIQGGLPPGMSQAETELPHVAAPPDGGGGGGNVISKARKDRFMVPINSDYDLYSAGADGQTKPTLQNPVSRDDVIRAGDGSYYGIAEHF